MADVDIDSFGEHELRPDDHADEHIPLDLVTPGRSSTWDPRGSLALWTHENSNVNRKHHLEEESLKEPN